MKKKFFIFLLLIINISFINNSYCVAINKKSIAKSTIKKSETKSIASKLTQKPKCHQSFNRTESCLVVDMNNGKIISSQNHEAKIYPASLTKMMTLYITFKRLQNNEISMEDRVYFSSNATSMRPSKLGVSRGSSISVKEAIYALIIKSANDVAVALAEYISSDESRFSQIMTNTARSIGMKDTTFKNASGWHHDQQKTTAKDLAILTMRIHRDFPQYYKMFSKTEYVINGQAITSHNIVLKTYPYAEGMKTGYTGPAGYNLVTTAKMGDKRLVGVVVGQPSSQVRNQKMISLLNGAFRASGVSISSNYNSGNYIGSRNLDLNRKIDRLIKSPTRG